MQKLRNVLQKPDCETVNRVRVARIPARDCVICVNFSSIPKNIFENKNMNVHTPNMLLIFRLLQC